MRREIIDMGLLPYNNCCPGHDDWPADKYANNRSVRARSRDIKKEHRYVRRINKMKLKTVV
jgi:hypothetical protein